MQNIEQEKEIANFQYIYFSKNTYRLYITNQRLAFICIKDAKGNLNTGGIVGELINAAYTDRKEKNVTKNQQNKTIDELIKLNENNFYIDNNIVTQIKFTKKWLDKKLHITTKNKEIEITINLKQHEPLIDNLKQLFGDKITINS